MCFISRDRNLRPSLLTWDSGETYFIQVPDTFLCVGVGLEYFHDLLSGRSNGHESTATHFQTGRIIVLGNLIQKSPYELPVSDRSSNKGRSKAEIKRGKGKKSPPPIFHSPDSTKACMPSKCLLCNAFCLVLRCKYKEAAAGGGRCLRANYKSLIQHAREIGDDDKPLILPGSGL